MKFGFISTNFFNQVSDDYLLQSTATGFTCQHGEKECKGNMVMSCAYQKLSPGRKQLDFTSCFMADPDHGGPEVSGTMTFEVEPYLRLVMYRVIEK